MSAKKLNLRRMSPHQMQEHIEQLIQFVVEQEDAIKLLMGALQEVTLQSQFILRTLSETTEVCGLADIKPRKVTVRLLDVYKQRRAKLIEVLEHERKSAEEARQQASANGEHHPSLADTLAAASGGNATSSQAALDAAAASAPRYPRAAETDQPDAS